MKRVNIHQVHSDFDFLMILTLCQSQLNSQKDLSLIDHDPKEKPFVILDCLLCRNEENLASKPFSFSEAFS